MSALGVPARQCAACRGVYIHIGVGFCVVRSYWIGQCEGLCRAGRATGTDSRAFFVYVRSCRLVNSLVRGASGQKKFSMKTRLNKQLPVVSAGSVKWFCVALCLTAGFGLSACSDDDDEGGGGGTPAQQPPKVADVGIQHPVTQFARSWFEIDGFTYADGRMTGGTYNGGRMSFSISSNPMVIREWYEGEDRTSTYSNIKVNESGFVTSADCSFSRTDSLGGTDGTASARFTYDANGYLLTESGTNTGISDGESYSYSWSSTYTWSDGNLMRVETSYVEDGETETDVITYTYGRSDWTNSGVDFPMEVGYCGNFFGDFGDEYYIFSAGLMGRLTKNIPTRVVKMGDNGAYSRTHTINEVEYNPDGSIRKITMDGYEYGYYGYPAYPIQQQQGTYSAAAAAKTEQAARSLKRTHRMMRR